MAWDSQGLINHDRDVHGIKKRCGEPGCDFIFPDSHWRLYRYHYQQAHPTMAIQEPSLVVKPSKKRKSSSAGSSKTPSVVNDCCVPVSIPLDHISMFDGVKKGTLPVTIPLERITEDGTKRLRVHTSFHLTTSMESGSNISDWEAEPESGFLELLDDDVTTVIEAGLHAHSPMVWKLEPIHVAARRRRSSTQRTLEKKSLDPRLH